MSYTKRVFSISSRPKSIGFYQIQVHGMDCDCCWINAYWGGRSWSVDQDEGRRQELKPKVIWWRGAGRKSAVDSVKTNACERTYSAIQGFALRMEACSTVRDGVLTARIIGEFSAGKTRLLHELLRDKTPPRLFPVSSLERQTKLQLELTHGPVPTLSLVERAQDTEAAIHLEELADFPTREEIDDTRYDPRRHRLRLAIPEERLLLPDGDGLQADKVPMRLFLIDTPGWNSGDDEIAEDAAQTFLTGYHNLALVYVSTAERLDGAISARRLREFMAAMDNADFLGTPNLLFIVTRCPSIDSARLSERATQMVMQFWQEIAGNRPIDLHVMCIDFGEKSDHGAQQLQGFKDEFWGHLLAPLGNREITPEHPWLRPIRQWSVDQTDKLWDIRPRFRAAQQQLQKIDAVLKRARLNGEFLLNYNMTKLLGCSVEEIRTKVRTRWLQQIEVADHQALASLFIPPAELDPEHPLADWWDTCWRAGFARCVGTASQFIARFELALAQLSDTTKDLNAHFDARLSDVHAAAQLALDCSFTRMVEVAASLAAHDRSEKAVATALTLSLLEARYCDHYEMATARLAAVEEKGA